jgi:hypothetical protein
MMAAMTPAQRRNDRQPANMSMTAGGQLVSPSGRLADLAAADGRRLKLLTLTTD